MSSYRVGEINQMPEKEFKPTEELEAEAKAEAEYQAVI
jgi:hypothetical protein